MDALLDETGDGGPGEDDPRGMARLMRSVSEESGEPLDGGDADLLERMEAGEPPPDDDAEGDEGEGP